MKYIKVKATKDIIGHNGIVIAKKGSVRCVMASEVRLSFKIAIVNDFTICSVGNGWELMCELTKEEFESMRLN